MQTFSVELVQVELWPIAWKQFTVIWNLQASLFQLLSNILVYKSSHEYIYIYIFFCKFLSVVFKASSTILSMIKGLLVVRTVHGRTSCDILFLPLPLLSRTSWKFFISRSVSWHANWLLCLLLARFNHCATGSALNSLYSHTRQSIHYVFCVNHS